MESTNQIELHISLVSKKDEFVFINSRPSGADMQQSVNQTCIKLQGSEPAPDPVFWRVNNQGENRGSTIFCFYFKNQFRLGVYQATSLALHCPSELPLGGGVLLQSESLPSLPSFGLGERRVIASASVLQFGPELGCACAHTHTRSHPKTKNAEAQ